MSGADRLLGDAPLDPALDLEVTRHLDAPPDTVWRCLTDPDLLVQWWAPKPVETRIMALDLCPGGAFHLQMDVPGQGLQDLDFCVLSVVPGRQLVWTDFLTTGFRPRAASFHLTGIFTLTPEGGGTRWRARAQHISQDSMARHRDMGFAEGWGICADQLGHLAAGLHHG